MTYSVHKNKRETARSTTFNEGCVYEAFKILDWPAAHGLWCCLRATIGFVLHDKINVFFYISEDALYGQFASDFWSGAREKTYRTFKKTLGTILGLFLVALASSGLSWAFWWSLRAVLLVVSADTSIKTMGNSW